MSDVIFELNNNDDRLNLDENLPHKLSFIESKKIEDSFMYSSLYSLTNTKLYMKRFLPIMKTEVSKGEKDYEFFELMKNIYDDINNKNEKCNEQTLELIKKFKDSLGNEIKDPRVLIRYILVGLLTLREIEIKKELKKTNSDISDFLSGAPINALGSNVNERLSCNVDLDMSLMRSFDWTDNQQDLDNDEYNIIIKKISNENKSEYGIYNYIKLYLSEEKKVYTLEQCLEDYLKGSDDPLLTNVSSPNKIIFSDIDKKLYYKFPKSIIIFIYYKKNDKDEENPLNYFYNFSESLNLSKANFVDEDIQFKEYFLSSLIVCKFPKNEERKFYYTYCRKNKESNYIIYNSKDKDIRDIKEKFKFVQNILKKEKIEDKNSSKSYPYVLIYTAV